MDALEAILRRRSIRKYRPDPVEPAKVTKLLAAAMAAPSAGNEQPWHFLILTERARLDAIPEVHPYAQMLKEAPLAIVVCGDERLEKHTGYWVQDCAAAVQNILVAATGLGLGSVWLGVHPREDRVRAVRSLLGVPAHVTPLAIVALGYGAEEKGPSERYNDERVHREKW